MSVLFRILIDLGRVDPKSGAKQKARVPKIAPTERSKFQDLQHPFMPPGIPAFQSALAEVDQTQPAPFREHRWKYAAPEPALLITAENPERVWRYLGNWLRIRQPLLWILDQDSSSMQKRGVGPLNPSEWREFLNFSAIGLKESTTKQTHHAIRRRKVFEMFQLAFGADNVLDDSAEVQWLGQPLLSSTEVSQELMQQVLCELSAVGFRYELTELDRYLVPTSSEPYELREAMRRRMIQKVFPSKRSFLLEALPAKNEGLAALDIRDRAESLEALRLIISRWPCVPTHVKSSVPLTGAIPVIALEQMEREVFKCYVQAFWGAAGRAAVLPRRFPNIA